MGDDINFEHLRLKFNKNYEKIFKAHSYVKSFIVKNKLILKGGTALDYSLRLKGEQLYEDDEVPDYDFYSPKHVFHAYKLASELIDMKFENVNVINAIHTTTISVWTMGVSIADITYCPKNIYDKMDVIVYDKVKVVHPYYTICDQASALSRPYDNPPREVIFSRIKKDNDRINLLLQYYPFEDVLFETKDDFKHKPKYFGSSNSRMITGYHALNILEGNALAPTPTIPYYYCNSIKKKLKTVKSNYGFLDGPKSFETKNAVYLDMGGIPIAGIKHKKYGWVAHPVSILWFFLYQHLYASREWAYEGIVRVMTYIKKNPKLSYSTVWNSENEAINSSLIYQRLRFKREAIGLIPPNYYSNNNEKIKQPTKKEWNYDNSFLFKIDGSKLS
jgi:hypothetical protein